MKKSVSLLGAFFLMSSGWAGAFLLAHNPSVSQSYWLIPALTIGMSIGLCLRFVDGKKTALTLALTAAIGMVIVNHFFPDSRVSVESVRNLFTGVNTQVSLLQVKVDSRYQTAPFDKPLILKSPVSLDLSLFTRFPAGVDDFCFSDDETLYASLSGLGAVYRYKQSARDVTGESELFLHSLDNPTGLACGSDQLLVSETAQIKAYPYVGGAGDLLIGQLPDDGGERGHRLQQMADGLLFSIGSRCDACTEEDPLRATLQLLNSNGQLQVYSRGLRSVGGLAYNEADDSFWASERSRIYPEPGTADELNRLQREGDYGWPLCDGSGTTDAPDSPCNDASAAEMLLQSRANPAGLMVTSRLDYPLVYRNSLLMVLQGDSKYSIVPAVVRIQLSAGEVGEPVAFLGGWDGKTARPSAIHSGPDGAVYLSDEINGAIYRAAWRRPD